MTRAHSKLAEYAAPTRGRPKYASLTAGLLARKGEALPATPFFAAEALDMPTAGPIVLSRHEPALAAHDYHAHEFHAHEPAHGPARETFELHADPAGRPGARARGIDEQRQILTARVAQEFRRGRRVEPDAEEIDAKRPVVAQASATIAASAPAPQPEAPRTKGRPNTERVALSLELDLEVLALLALHARHAGVPPGAIIAEALRAHLVAGPTACLLCAKSLGRAESTRI